MEHFILLKSEQPGRESFDRKAYLAEHELD